MKRVPTTMRPLAAILAVLAGAACMSSREDGPTAPAIFEPDVISTTAPEFAMTFAPDGRTLYFNRASADRSQIMLLESRRTDGGWTAPSPVGFSGPDRDLDPFFSPDGTRLYFSSDRLTSATDSIRDFNTWFVERSAAGFRALQVLPEPLNTPATEVFASVTRSGALFFSSDRDGVMRIYRGRIDDPDAPPELVSVDLNTAAGGAGNPLVAPDGAFLLFTATSPAGQGGADVYITRPAGDGWLPSQPLGGGVNSPYADFAPALGPDGRLLFFTSERPGIVAAVTDGARPPGDIYHVRADAVGLPAGGSR
jgi:Tol biopolymer transport system component